MEISIPSKKKLYIKESLFLSFSEIGINNAGQFLKNRSTALLLASRKRQDKTYQ